MLRTLIFLALVVLSGGSFAKAGVTIHYQGIAASPDAVAKILAGVTAAAKKNQWKVEDASAKRGKLERVIDEKLRQTVDGREKDLFFHSNELLNVKFDELREGDKVSFEVGESPKGPNAVKVSRV